LLLKKFKAQRGVIAIETEELLEIRKGNAIAAETKKYR